MAARRVELSAGARWCLLTGAWIYARALPPAGRSAATSRCAASSCCWPLLQVYANFGPAPASETAMAIMALGLYVTLAAMAALVERLRAV